MASTSNVQWARAPTVHPTWVRSDRPRERVSQSLIRMAHLESAFGVGHASLRRTTRCVRLGTGLGGYRGSNRPLRALTRHAARLAASRTRGGGPIHASKLGVTRPSHEKGGSE